MAGSPKLRRLLTSHTESKGPFSPQHYLLLLPTRVWNAVTLKNVGSSTDIDPTVLPFEIGREVLVEHRHADKSDDNCSPPPLFDVFLSHTTADKKDVLCIHVVLEVLGFSTFFDIASIRNVVEGDIIDGLKRSRHLLAWCSTAMFDSSWACREQWSFLLNRGPSAVTSYAVGISVEQGVTGGMRTRGPIVDSDLIPDVPNHGPMPLGFALMYGRVEKNVVLPLSGPALRDIVAKLYTQLDGTRQRDVTPLVSTDDADWLLERVVGKAEMYARRYGSLSNVPAERLKADVLELQREFRQQRR